jgi:hypothetical protein
MHRKLAHLQVVLNKSKGESMNRKTLLSGLAAALLFTAACSSPSTANKPANTAPAANTNTASKPTNTAPAATANTNTDTAQQPVQDFTLVNQTGVEIHSVFISPHNVDDWEEDILGRDTLADKDHVDITFKRGEKAAMWDLRVEDQKGNSIEWENLNLLAISKITLHYKDGKATAETE